jgi:PIN domain nuclease of toxin-antitoxin system
MIYLLDTVTLVRYLSGKGKIGKSASAILNTFENSDFELAISVISLMEIMYLSEKGRIGIDLLKTIQLISETEGYKIIDLNSEIILTAAEIDFYELHDRMILSTAKWLDVPILSSDKRFVNINGIDVIWD